MCVLLINAGASGGILCIGEDGHTHVEMTFHDVCDAHIHSCASHEETLEVESQTEMDHSHEKHCIDIPLALGIFKPTTSVQFDIHTILCVIPAMESSPELNSGSIDLDLIPPNNPSLRDLNTVILLT